MKTLLKEKFAFTLAEVLITLLIIGVIAALTIPTFLRKYNDHVTVTRVKAAQSMLSVAVKKAIAEYGDMVDWVPGIETYYGENGSYAPKIFAQLKTTKDCTFGLFSSAFSCPKLPGGLWNPGYKNMDGSAKGLNGHPHVGGQMIMSSLENGMLLWIAFTGQKGNHGVCSDNINNMWADNGVCAVAYVDINGAGNGPNTYGLDTFAFIIKKDGAVLPFGVVVKKVGHGLVTLPGNSKTNEYYTFWVVTRGNMDYKYRNVSSEW